MTRLVVFAPNWLGDAVMALPAVDDVHRASPETSITVAARPAIAPLYNLVPHVDDVVVFEDDGWRRGMSVPLRNGGFSTALLLPNSFHSALVAFHAGIPERWGYRTDWRGYLLTRAIARAPAGVHQIEYYQQLVHALGFPNGPVEPRLELPAALRAEGAATLAAAGWNGHAPVLALAPGAAYGGAKRWPAEFFAELVEALASDGVVTVMIGSAADTSTGRQIEARLLGRARPLNLIGATDLPSVAGVLVNSRALVSNDSGAMHLAAAVGVRVTAIFGPSDERATGPRGAVPLKPSARQGTLLTRQGTLLTREETLVTRQETLVTRQETLAHAIVSHPVWCRPCLLRECPLDHQCMRGVRVDRVLAEAQRTL